MAEHHQEDWKNYWKNRNSASSESPGIGVERDEFLSEFWASQLKGFDTKSKIMDLACGAGTITKTARKLEFSNIVGSDISEHAIETLKTNFPEVEGVAAPAQDLPFKDDEFDAVFSQFGFEYAPLTETISELARVIKPGGQFTALCHIKDGLIAKEVEENVAMPRGVLNTGYIEKYKHMIEKDFDLQENVSEEKKQLLTQAQIDMGPCHKELSLWVERYPKSLARHLLDGSMQLFNRRRNYYKSDIINWMDGMTAELKTYEGCLASMLDSMFDQEKAGHVIEQFEQTNFEMHSLEKLTQPNQTDHFAWIISGQLKN